jgi:hypothetical protein
MPALVLGSPVGYVTHMPGLCHPPCSPPHVRLYRVASPATCPAAPPDVPSPTPSTLMWRMLSRCIMLMWRMLFPFPTCSRLVWGRHRLQPRGLRPRRGGARHPDRQGTPPTRVRSRLRAPGHNSAAIGPLTHGHGPQQTPILLPGKGVQPGQRGVGGRGPREAAVLAVGSCHGGCGFGNAAGAAGAAGAAAWKPIGWSGD